MKLISTRKCSSFETSFSQEPRTPQPIMNLLDPNCKLMVDEVMNTKKIKINEMKSSWMNNDAENVRSLHEMD